MSKNVGAPGRAPPLHFGAGPGPDLLRRYLFTAFPDIQYTAEDKVSQIGKVWIRWTMRATHAGPFIGISPTGKRVAMSGVDMLDLARGRIVALRVEANLLGLAHQLRAVPNLNVYC